MRKYHEKLTEPHALYRFFHKKKLLYVGVTYQFPARMSHHASTRGWFKEIDRITIEWFPNFLAGSMAEREAIRVEGPVYNLKV